MAPLMDEVVVLLLAAGQGLRFYESGGLSHKLQASLAGKPLLEHVLASVSAAQLPLHIVTPASNATRGMGDSIAHGVRATADASGWLILPADMPLVRPATLQAVARALVSQRHYHAVVPTYCEQAGHPVAFAASCQGALRGLSGDQGARSVLQHLNAQQRLMHLTVDDPGIVFDVDTCADLQRAEALLRRTSLMD